MKNNPLPFTSRQRSAFRAALLRWFASERRSLPWRAKRDPYRIWISEIMLQQTRVGAVQERYAEFLRRFPDVNRLAAARPQDVLAAWSGLGYYRRARSLHAAARIIVRDHAGRLPATAETLRSLPGIGRYTAAAIASIAFGEPCAAVDGNVERVLRRILAWRKQALPQLWNAAQQLLSPRAPGDFNQAMMELGATLCLPRQPRCDLCPLRRLCATRGPLERRAMSPRKSAEVTHGLACRAGRVYLVRRDDRQSLMPGMWELPQLPNADGSRDGAPDGGSADFTLRHSITVTDYTIHICRIKTARAPRGRWFSLEQAAALPLTGLTRRVFRRAALI
ncbi:MAG: A/G-specific adenine glycosylase [Terriglobales bacterium]